MSSSESEEFFDAEDVTPLKIRSVSIENRYESPRKDSDVSINYEEEAKKLLEQRRLVEQRRKTEEEEIEKKLEEIERKRQEEQERIKKLEFERKQKEEELKQEAEKRAQEQEKRRKKLDQLRQSVVDESTPQKLNYLETGESLSPDQTDQKSRSNSTNKNVGKSLQAVTEATQSKISDIVTSSSSSQSYERNIVDEENSEASNNGENCNEVAGLTDIPVGDNIQSIIVHSDNVENVKEAATCQSVNSELQNVGHSQDLNLNMPDAEKLDKKDIPTIEIIESQPILDSTEPDIVKSTKNIRPTDMLPPVAPPRRKKKGKGSAASDTNLPSVSVMTPTSTVESLTKDLEQSLGLPAGNEADLKRIPSMAHSLDIQQVISGERLVTVKETECVVSVADELQAGVADKSLNDSVFEQDIPNMDECDQKELQRPRSNSGRLLTDKEILESIGLKNLDTGEMIPLSKAEEIVPKGVNPLALHIMKMTLEFPSGDPADGESDEDRKSIASASTNSGKVKRRGRLKKLLGRTVHKIKSIADEVLHTDESSSDEEEYPEGQRIFRKWSRNHKGPFDFENLKQCQDLTGEHTGAVWIMKFSYCGRLLASGGQDNMLRVWVLKDSYAYFDDMRQKYSENRSSPTPSQKSQDSLSTMADDVVEASGCEEDKLAPFKKKSFCTYRGHTADVLDVSWSKNYFLLTSSMDKTVRLWHISRKECLCCFQHIDFVTAIAFHPRDDRYFLSGSLDGKLRLWNIPDKKVALWNEVSGPTKLITAASFCQNGKFAVVGTYDGRCIFYNTEQLKYYTLINVRSTRGRNAKGHKITGIESLPGEDRVLVTSNDSRIRLYDLRDLTLTCKYKGGSNNSSQIKAVFSHDGKYIVCGSEDRMVYMWKTHHESPKLSSARRDRNDYWEAFRAHEAVVTSAIFAPNPLLLLLPTEESFDGQKCKDTKPCLGEALVTADFNGCIKVFTTKFQHANDS